MGARTELDIMLVEYETLREDDRATTNTQTALAGVFVALLAGLFAILVGDCRFRISTVGGASCYELFDPVYVIAPLLPLAVLAYTVMLGIQLAIRSFYMRAIENEIRKHVSSSLDAIPELTAASGAELLLTVTSPRRGSLAYRSMLTFLTVSFIIAIGGWVTFAALGMNLTIKIVMISLYGPLLMLMVYGG